MLREVKSQDIEDEFALLEEELSDDEVVTASKRRQSIFWSPSAITVFTRAEIESSGAMNLPDLLRRVPGFDVYNVKPAYSLVGARAMSQGFNNLVLLLIDGREALVELTGFAFWNALDIDMEEIERVEVIRGPGSALYGANAFAAVVSVTTVAEHRGYGGDVYLSGGEEGFNRLFGRFRGKLELDDGNLTYKLGVGRQLKYNPSDGDLGLGIVRALGRIGYRQGRSLNLSLHSGVVAGEGTIFLFAGDTRATDVAFPWVMGKAEFSLGESSSLAVQVYYNHYEANLHFRAPLRFNDMWVADIPDIPWEAYSLDGQVQLNLEIAQSFLLITGGNLRQSTMQGSTLALKDDTELRGGCWINLQWEPLEMLQLTAGLRLDLNEATGAALSPRTVLVFRPWENQAFRLGYGLAFRKPSFLESRFHLRVESYNESFREIVDVMANGFGNEELQNMKVHSFEAGWQARFLEDRLRLSADMFYNIYLDYIIFATDVPSRLGLPDISQANIEFINQSGRAHAFGGEMEVVWRLPESWSLFGNLGLRKVRIYQDGEVMDVDEPTVRCNLGGRYLSRTGVLLDLALHYVSEYWMWLPNPHNNLGGGSGIGYLRQLGETLLAIGRIGYRITGQEQMRLEIGAVFQLPLSGDFLEFYGVPVKPEILGDTPADFGGEHMNRVISLYLRGSI